jgi:c-di-GMP-binding flagellar brake protein YcgR
MTPESPDERRQAPRRLLRRPATILLPGEQQLQVRSLDISSGGMGIVAPANPPIGMACGIRFQVPGPNAAPVVVQTRVKVMQSTWSTADDGFKVGLQFQELSPAHQKLIRDYLES